MGGRPPGRRNFETDFNAALSTIIDKATGKPITRVDLMSMAIRKALAGEISFERIYTHTVDQIYGKAIASIEVSDIETEGYTVTEEEKRKIDTIIKKYDRTKAK